MSYFNKSLWHMHLSHNDSMPHNLTFKNCIVCFTYTFKYFEKLYTIRTFLYWNYIINVVVSRKVINLNVKFTWTIGTIIYHTAWTEFKRLQLLLCKWQPVNDRSRGHTNLHPAVKSHAFITEPHTCYTDENST